MYAPQFNARAGSRPGYTIRSSFAEEKDKHCRWGGMTCVCERGGTNCCWIMSYYWFRIIKGDELHLMNPWCFIISSSFRFWFAEPLDWPLLHSCLNCHRLLRCWFRGIIIRWCFACYNLFDMIMQRMIRRRILLLKLYCDWASIVFEQERDQSTRGSLDAMQCVDDDVVVRSLQSGSRPNIGDVASWPFV